MKVKVLIKPDAKLVAVRPEDTVETTASLLSSNNIGAVPVRDGDGNLVGLISERDIVRGFARKGGKVLSLKVRDLMTASVITCTSSDSVKDVANVMIQRSIRHLPVVDEGELVAMISLRDVVKNRLAQTELEANVLREAVIVTGGIGKI
ncbi:MAG: CBS domain-containing protein [Magnetospirillum sp. WYHS-4]